MGEKSSSECTTRLWFEKFRSGNLRLEDEEDRGRSSLIDNHQLRSIIEADSRKTTREIASEFLNNRSSFKAKSERLGSLMSLPHDLNENQKNRRLLVSSSLVLRNKNEPFLYIIDLRQEMDLV